MPREDTLEQVAVLPDEWRCSGRCRRGEADVLLLPPQIWVAREKTRARVAVAVVNPVPVRLAFEEERNEGIVVFKPVKSPPSASKM